MDKRFLATFLIQLTILMVVSGCKKKDVEDVNVNINSNVSVSDNEKEDVEIIEDDEDIEVITSDIDISNWQTYRSEEFGFEMKYPEGWKLTEIEFKGDPLIGLNHEEIEVRVLPQGGYGRGLDTVTGNEKFSLNGVNINVTYFQNQLLAYFNNNFNFRLEAAFKKSDNKIVIMEIIKTFRFIPHS